MAHDLVNMGNQFSGLDMDALIGGPLKAICNAQMMLAASTVKFIEEVGLEEAGPDGIRKVRTTSFSFNRTAFSEEGAVKGTEEVSMAVPLLSIVKNPTFGVDDATITFDMEVKSSECSEKTKDMSGELEGNAGIKIGPFNMDVKIKGSVACNEKNTRSSDNSAKYHIELHARDYGMPEGLARMLDILATAGGLAPVAQKAAS